MRSTNAVKLSSSLTIEHYRSLELNDDRAALASFIVERFEERYFRPVGESHIKHGFTIIAVCCLVIETLESFYQGHGDTRSKSAQMFRDFFKRDDSLRIFGEPEGWFFRDIRCGILHQGEARCGWRILRSGDLLDASAKTINATKLLRQLRKAVIRYGNLLREDDECWNKFKKKMKVICANCL
jgi:hypothetical protein